MLFNKDKQCKKNYVFDVFMESMNECCELQTEDAKEFAYFVDSLPISEIYKTKLCKMFDDSYCRGYTIGALNTAISRR